MPVAAGEGRKGHREVGYDSDSENIKTATHEGILRDGD